MSDKVLAPPTEHDKKYVKLSEFIIYLVGVFFYTNMTGMVGSYRSAYLVNVLRLNESQVSLFNTLVNIIPFVLNFFITMYIDGRRPGKSGKFRPLALAVAIPCGVLLVLTFWAPPALSGNLLLVYVTTIAVLWAVATNFGAALCAVVGTILMLVATKAIRERVTYSSEKKNPLTGIKDVLINKYAWVILISEFLKNFRQIATFMGVFLAAALLGSTSKYLSAQFAGNQDTAIVRYRLSHDGGRSWGAIDTLLDQPGTFIRQPISVMSDGNWLLPVFYCRTEPGEKWVGNNDVSAVKISSDCGKSWRDVAVPESLGCVHMSITPLPDGRLAAFFRSRWADHIWFSQSSDQGESWSAPVPTTLPNNNSSIQATPLDNGELALVFNNMSAAGATERRASLPGRTIFG